MDPRLKIAKPVFWKKTRVYNDLYKRERLGLATKASTPNTQGLVVAKPSYLEKVFDLSVGNYSSFSLRGGKLYLTSAVWTIDHQESTLLVIDQKLYQGLYPTKKLFFLVSYSYPYQSLSPKTLSVWGCFFSRLIALKFRIRP